MAFDEVSSRVAKGRDDWRRDTSSNASKFTTLGLKFMTKGENPGLREPVTLAGSASPYN